MASEVLNTISKDWNERCRLESELKYELDLQSKIIHAKQQSDEKWQKVVDDKDAKLADKDAKLADKDAKIEQLRSQLAEYQRGGSG